MKIKYSATNSKEGQINANNNRVLRNEYSVSPKPMVTGTFERVSSHRYV